ncbi:ThuA domain-containing protein [Micromonospora sp. WMMD1082]|uniref:ThuA domain-containing protein n=1 Tax=Micromonospora sp. WMMD1082 TaxID=3016104 RepID=UPI0024169623|nr:ThuA domain-containing protein [Micromonospora sp. WMMD1082]MDG4798480.1 ThuA domain-containing protein [Micromonospora sp. WMMD1082]
MTESLLVFSKTAGYRHDSIPAAIAAISDLGFAVSATEDARVFTADLSDVDGIVFLSTTGEVLDDRQRAGLRRRLSDGAGFVGVHSAANTETGWPFFRGLIGAGFAGHPPLQPGRILVTDPDHPASAHLGEVWDHVDEWYDFDANPRAHVRVLLQVDESSYRGGTMGADHPVAWSHVHDNVRCFYTSLGHAAEAYADPALREHLRGGIASVLRHG